MNLISPVTTIGTALWGRWRQKVDARSGVRARYLPAPEHRQPCSGPDRHANLGVSKVTNGSAQIFDVECAVIFHDYLTDPDGNYVQLSHGRDRIIPWGEWTIDWRRCDHRIIIPSPDGRYDVQTVVEFALKPDGDRYISFQGKQQPARNYRSAEASLDRDLRWSSLLH